MPDLYKTLGAIEFAEIFEALQKKALENGEKFNAAKLARLLKMSDSAVSQILKKGKNPGARSLHMIRELMTESDVQPAKAQPIKTEPPEDLSKKLDYLRDHAPAKYETAKQVILSLAESVVEYSSSPKVDQARKAVERLADPRAGKHQSPPPHK